MFAVTHSFDGGLLPSPSAFMPFFWVWILSFAMFFSLFSISPFSDVEF